MITAAELLAEIGDSRERYPTRDAADAGHAAVAKESGKWKTAGFRRACNKRLRVAFCRLADSSRHWHPWGERFHHHSGTLARDCAGDGAGARIVGPARPLSRERIVRPGPAVRSQCDERELPSRRDPSAARATARPAAVEPALSCSHTGLKYFRSMLKREATDAVRVAMRAKGLTFADMAAELKRPRVWVAAAVLGQHPFSSEEAEKLVALLGLPHDVAPALEEIPTRGGLGAAVPVDPTIYRLYEALQVYGPALKALIHEDFGDGIMSAINFRADIERVPDPAGDRVRITFDGKFLPHQWG